MRSELKIKQQQSTRRANRTRARVQGTPERPRLSVHRSNRAYYAQVIDDTTGHTLASANSKVSKNAEGLGVAIAEALKSKGVTKVVFDRGALQYGGNLAKLAEAARTAGLDF